MRLSTLKALKRNKSIGAIAVVVVTLLIVGFFVGPIGIIAGPFFGALIGELINNQGNWNGVFKAALGAFIGFLIGTGIKMICVLAFIFIYVASFV